MRKIIVACVLAAAVFAGCSTPSHTESRKPAAATEPSYTEAKNDMDKEFEDKVKAIDELGQEAIENIRTEASKAISQIQAAVPTTIATTTIPEPKEVVLNVESESRVGTMRFISAKVDYEYGLLKLFFTLEATQDFEFDYDNVACLDKNGKSLSRGAYGGTINRPAESGYRNITVDDGNMFFGKVDSETDLSTVTLTYAFEGFDPVTVTFDIPV